MTLLAPFEPVYRGLVPPLSRRLLRGSAWLWSARLDLAEWFALLLAFGVFAYLLAPLAGAPSLYPDSGTVLSISRTLAQGDPSIVWSTQSPALQDSLYAALLALDVPVGTYPTVVSSFGLGLLLGFFAYRATGDRLAAAVPLLVIAFSSAFWIQAGYLTLYSGFVLLGWCGLYLALGYMVHGRSFWWCVGGSLLLAASVYTFTTAIVFMIVPCLAVPFFFSREVARRLGVVWLMVGTLVAPWVIWHLKVGGLKYFYYHPLNWFGVKYLAIVNDEFWHYERTSLWGYSGSMLNVALHDLVPPALLLLVIPGVWYVWRKLGAKDVLFAFVCLAAYAGVLLFTRPAPYARYFFPILPLVVLFVSAGIWVAIENAGSVVGRAGLIALIVATGAVALLGEVPSPVSSAQYRYVDRLETSSGYGDFTAMAELISNTKGGVIARDSSLQALIPNNQMFTHYLLSEDDYVTFLSWRDDGSVIAMLKRRGIEWVLLYQDPRWERDYHVWLERAYGVAPDHYVRVTTSPWFEHVYQGERFQLYHLRPDAVTQ
jgi:hypothetical protein